MKNKDKKMQNISRVPAWECPKCGTTHPITVESCCKNSKIDKTDQMPSFPFDPRSPLVPMQPYNPFVAPLPYCITTNQ